MSILGKFLDLCIKEELHLITDEKEQDIFLYELELGIQELLRWYEGDTKDVRLKNHWLLQSVKLRQKSNDAKKIWCRV